MNKSLENVPCFLSAPFTSYCSACDSNSHIFFCMVKGSQKVPNIPLSINLFECIYCWNMMIYIAPNIWGLFESLGVLLADCTHDPEISIKSFAVPLDFSLIVICERFLQKMWQFFTKTGQRLIASHQFYLVIIQNSLNKLFKIL